MESDGLFSDDCDLIFMDLFFFIWFFKCLIGGDGVVFNFIRIIGNVDLFVFLFKYLDMVVIYECIDFLVVSFWVGMDS